MRWFNYLVVCLLAFRPNYIVIGGISNFMDSLTLEVKAELNTMLLCCLYFYTRVINKINELN